MRKQAGLTQFLTLLKASHPHDGGTHFIEIRFVFNGHSVPVDRHDIDRLGDAFERDGTRS
jgi:hypothetical protein